ncbi:hypothetical protein F2Q68_00005131 [Brassica cretica]|uniref:Uncharacterized protein n=2 Tax=Brassica cretica TaxID=69181 RepID=A0A3N6PWR8_BRACR|nr:hypothetical protein F2Q68_00005131 [Brassica cretica]KAF3545566.1 hypothetical protein DY000_02007767 [Brassica cretica]
MKAFPSSREEFQLSLCPGDGSLLELGHYQSAPQERTRVIDSSYQACPLGLSEEHPQPVGKLSLLKWLIHWDP